jgi:hypothetical protein
VTKTFIKGVIAIGVFSLFLNIASNVVHYFIFLGLSFGALGLFILYKRGSTFKIGEESIVVSRLFGHPNSFGYEDIYDISVAQGILAKRMNCGSVYVILKGGRGGVRLMGGGIAERFEDIPNPQYISELISSKLGPFSGPMN